MVETRPQRSRAGAAGRISEGAPGDAAAERRRVEAELARAYDEAGRKELRGTVSFNMHAFLAATLATMTMWCFGWCPQLQLFLTIFSVSILTMVRDKGLKVLSTTGEEKARRIMKELPGDEEPMDE